MTDSPATFPDQGTQIFPDLAAEQEVVCYHASLEALASEAPHLTSLLDAQERIRARTLRRTRERTRFMLAHGWMRCRLGEQFGCPAESLRFTTNEHGKPEIEQAGAPHFSFSASEDQAVIAMAEARPVGIDIECMTGIDVKIMLPMVGHATDNLILDLPGPEQGPAFYRLWTGKEAVLKAMGTGFRSDPRTIELGEDWLTGHAAAISLEAFGQSFRLHCAATEDYVISLALTPLPA